MTRDPLEVRLGGRPVAAVIDAGGGLCALRYLPDVVREHRDRPVLSVRLPARDEPYPAMDGAQVFLDNLLPDGPIRTTLADRGHLDPADTFGLLLRYGGDCAGAVSFGPAEAIDRGVRWLDDDGLAQVIRGLGRAPLGNGLDGSIRISLGGLQEKLVVVWDQEADRFGIPTGDQPSTHILKPVPLDADGSERYPGLAEMEHYALTLLRLAAAESRLKVTAAFTQLLTTAGRRVLLVERYDRVALAGRFERLHQEDGCQALGLPPGRKYQEGPDGPPSLRAFAEVIRRSGADPLDDLIALVQQVAFTILCGNADMHVKNLALLHRPGLAIRLAPAYDVASTVMFDGTSHELGLRIGREYHLDDVGVPELVKEAESWGLGPSAVRRAILDLCDSVTEVAPRVAGDIEAGGRWSQPLARSHDRISRTAARWIADG